MTFTTNHLDHYKLNESKYEVCKIEHRLFCGVYCAENAQFLREAILNFSPFRAVADCLCCYQREHESIASPVVKSWLRHLQIRSSDGQKLSLQQTVDNRL